MNYLEIIRDISVFFVAVATFICLIILYVKIFVNTKKIKEINDKIEKEKEKFDKYEIENIKGHYDIKIDFDGSQGRNKIKMKQIIEKLKREKEYLLEEISIYKIFKK